ncbi:MAG: response regulator [Proteobacteria bacterium]|nr:response regulator [Pseudomonadota bacterium]
MKIRQKIIILLMVPFLGMFYFSYNGIKQYKNEKKEIKEIRKTIRFINLLSELVHAVQQERGLSTGFVGSRGKNFQKEMIKLRREVDIKIKLLNKLVTIQDNEVNSYIYPAASDLKILLLSFEQLKTIRAELEKLNLPVEKIIGNYNMINSHALKTIQQVTGPIEKEQITDRLLAFFHLMSVKEFAGIERAMLTSFFADRNVTNSRAIRLQSVVNLQKFHVQQFQSVAEKDAKQAFRKIIRGPYIQQTKVLQKIVLSGGNLSSANPESYYAIATGRINLFKQMEVYLLNQLVISVDGIEQKVDESLISDSLFSLTIILFSLIIVYFILEGIVTPIKKASLIAEKLSKGDLDVDITVDSGGEPGQLLTTMKILVESLQKTHHQVQVESEGKNKTLLELEAVNIQLKSLDRLKDDLLSNISHELQTPLNGIIGIAESLLDSKSEDIRPNTKNNLQLIQASGRRLSSLVADLLDFSRLKNRALRLNLKPLQLRSSIDLSIALLRHLVENDRIQIEYSGFGEIPNVYADEDRLQQILLNLIGNAIKYTDEGTIEIETYEKGDFIWVVIEDTGIGIPEDKLVAIFNSFEQVDAGINKKYGGTGLGLSITKQLVELHQGQIFVESELDKGSLFKFSLPITTLDADDQSSPHLWETVVDTENEEIGVIEKELVRNLNKNHPTILVVDDDPIARHLLINQLSHQEFNVITAKNGLEAIEKLEEYQLDLILLDLMMPYMNGYEFCEKVREEYNANSLPIIILTARHQIEDLITSLKSGANDYLTKPFQKSELLARVHSQLKLKEINSLKQELTHQIQHEKNLLASKYQLVKSLKSSNHALIFVDRRGDIQFANSSALEMLNYPREEIELASLNQILQLPKAQQKAQSSELLNAIQSGEKEFIIQPLNGEGFPGQITCFNQADENNDNLAIIIKEDIKSGSSKDLIKAPEQLAALEKACLHVCQLSRKEGTSLVDCLMSLEYSLDEITKDVVSELHPLQLRKNVVKLMSHALNVWEAETRKTKFELAEESALWKVYIDQGQIRTRTFDKYLSLEFLPKNPRWNTVIKTVEHVLKVVPEKQTATLAFELSRFKNDLENQTHFSGF